MASADEQLPEGTDTIIEGAGSSEDRFEDDAAPASSPREDDVAAEAGSGARSDDSQPAITAIGNDLSGAKDAFTGRFDDLRGQASDRARDLAQAGKDRATSALDSLVQTVEDAAAEIDDKLGSQYGDYARRAAAGIGNFSDAFRDKDVDDLFADARALIARSPAIAVGTAAALGFVVARLARAGLAEANTNRDASGT